MPLARCQGGHDTGATYGPAPDIDHTNVQMDLIQWLKWLRDDIGFSGWRLDFAKGYAPAFAALYIDGSRPTGAVGELWTPLVYEADGRPAYDQNPHRQELCNWIDGTGGRASAFDFTTKGVLQYALEHTELYRLRDSQGKAAGLIGWYPERATTFIENHDTGSTQQHWPFPSGKVMQGYAYILTHSGVPCVFYDHFFEWGLQQPIAELLQVRVRNGIHAHSKLDILAAEDDLYVARVDDRVVVKIGPRLDMGQTLPSADRWQVVASGTDYAVWEALGIPYVPILPGLTNETTMFGQYCRELSTEALESATECLLEETDKPINPSILAVEGTGPYSSLLGETPAAENVEDEWRLEDEGKLQRDRPLAMQVLPGGEERGTNVVLAVEAASELHPVTSTEGEV